MPAPLRVVTPADVPRTSRPRRRKTFNTIEDACKRGERRDVLTTLRLVLAKSIDDPGTPARDIASLSRRLLEVVSEIETLDAQTAQELQESKQSASADERWTAI